jgi:endoglucanase
MIRKTSGLAIRLAVLWAATTLAGLACVDATKASTDASVVDDPTGLGCGALGPVSTVDDPDGGAGAGIDAGMRAITSMELVREMGIGWNLGNTLDALGGETAWGNPPTTQAMIQAIADAGFKSMRIPVTWRQHFGPAPDYVIDTTWMDRVQQIVDWALGAGLYAIVNMHHDGSTDTSKGAWIRNASKDCKGVLAQYRALWAQIAARFREHGDHLVFESMNEVGFDDLPAPTAYALLNRFNTEFVRLVRGSGGNNRERHLLIAGYNTDIDRTLSAAATGLAMPNDSRCILSIHYYTPYQFCINGKPSTWGSPGEINALLGQLAKLKTNFVDQGIPVILGEYGVASSTEAASRVFWIEYVTKTAFDYGIAPHLWDAGGVGGEFDRMRLTWRTPGLHEALLRAASGAPYTPTKG